MKIVEFLPPNLKLESKSDYHRHNNYSFFLHACIFCMFNCRDAIVGFRCLAWCLQVVWDSFHHVVDQIKVVEGSVDAEGMVVLMRNPQPAKKRNVASIVGDVVIVEGLRNILMSVLTCRKRKYFIYIMAVIVYSVYLRCTLGCFKNDTLSPKKIAIPVRTPQGCI